MVIVILDNIRSALNVGAILRTCDGAGVDKVILSGITPYPPHPKVVKTALGAENYLEIEHVKDAEEKIKDLKMKKVSIIAVEQTNSSKSYFEEKFEGDLALIFGNEITGVSNNLLNLCDRHIELPMLGKKASLNVSNTVAIILYHKRFLDYEKK